MTALDDLQARLGHRFNDQALLVQALTRPDWVAENGGKGGHNERLEFLGDAVLGLVVTERLIVELPDLREDALSRERSARVNNGPGSALHALAMHLDLGASIRAGLGATHHDRVAERPRVLCACAEAVLGAVFLDGGWDAVRTAAATWPEDLLRKRSEAELGQKDPKSRAKEWLEKRGGALPTPVFEQDAEGSWHATVVVEGGSFTGVGAKRTQAEKEAYAAFLRGVEAR